METSEENMLSKLMMVKIADYLNLPLDNITFNDEHVIASTVNGKKVSGFSTILSCIVKGTKSDIIQNSSVNPEIEAEVNQWIEYVFLYTMQSFKDKSLLLNLLKDFDAYLLNRSYLVGQFLTLADLINCYALFDVVKSLNLIEKERFINLSRWFDHVQRQEDIYREKDVLNFKVLHLYGGSSLARI